MGASRQSREPHSRHILREGLAILLILLQHLLLLQTGALAAGAAALAARTPVEALVVLFFAVAPSAVVVTTLASIAAAVANCVAGRGFFRYFFLDNTRMLSRIGGLFARLRVTPCFVWRFAAMTNIGEYDEETGFSGGPSKGPPG